LVLLQTLPKVLIRHLCDLNAIPKDDVSQHPKKDIINLLRILTSPLGKKSKPTIDSNTDDFPADYVPSTQILGNLIYY